jgi:hypothetical protein
MGEVNRFRYAMIGSVDLAQQGKDREALRLVDEAIAEAIREQQILWIRTLCQQAAVISYHLRDQQPVKQYYEQSLASDSENPEALYGLAKLADVKRNSKTNGKTLAARVLAGNFQITDNSVLVNFCRD